jgi:ABC-type sugar transport system substrate-binding protein
VKEIMAEEKITRRTSLKYAGGAALAAVVGAVAGYAYGTSAPAPAAQPGLVKTVTETQTVGSTQITTMTATNAYGSPKYKIDLLGYCLGVEFCIPMWNSLPDAVSLFPGLQVSWLGPSECDPKGMLDIAATIKDVRKPDATASYLDTPDMQKFCSEWIDAGIPSMSYLVDDNPPHPSKRLAYVGTAQYDAAYGTGTVFVNQYLKPKGITSGKAVIFIHRPGAPDLEDRVKGFTQALIDGGFKAADITKAAAGPEAAQSNDMAAAYLKAHSDVVVAAGVDGNTSPAVGESIDALGLHGKVLGMGFDLIPRSLTQVQKGNLLALANQQPYLIIPVLVMDLYMHLVSGKILMPFDANTGRGVVTADNVGQYTAKSKFY